MPRTRRLLTHNRIMAMVGVAIACLAFVLLLRSWLKSDIPARVAAAGFVYTILGVFFFDTTDSVRRGKIRMKGGRIYTRRGNPFAFWAHVVFFYAVITVFASFFAFVLIAANWRSEHVAEEAEPIPASLPPVERNDSDAD